MAKRKRTIENCLLSAQVAIHNALDDVELQGYLVEFGYDQAKLEAGQALYRATLAAQQARLFGRMVLINSSILHIHIRTTNLLERVFHEFRTKTDEIGAFPNEISCLTVFFLVVQRDHAKHGRPFMMTKTC